jgi:ABC-type multidrug transport system fused ATPase/permease subunit
MNLVFEKFFYDFVIQHKTTFFVYTLVILLFFPLEGVVLPKVYGLMFDKMKPSSSYPKLFDIWNNLKKGHFAGYLMLMIIIWALILFGDNWKQYIESTLMPQYFTYLRETFYDNTVKSNNHDFSGVNSGDYLSRVMELTRNMKDMFQFIISKLIPETIVTFFIIGYMCVTNASIGVVTMIGFFACLLVQAIGGYFLIDLIRSRENFFNTNLSGNLQDSLDNLMNVYINNEIDSEIKKNKKLEKESKERLSKIMMGQNIVLMLTRIIMVITYTTAIYVIYNMLVKGKINIATCIVFILLLDKFSGYAQNVNYGLIHHIIYKLGIVSASYEFIHNIFKDDSKRIKEDVITKGHVQFENLKYRYDKTEEEYLFDGLNLELKGGKKYGLTGRSGSGKSSLMKILVGLYTPESGSVKIDGVDITEIKLNSLRDNVNYINQTTTTFNETVVYNMLYGNNHITEKQLINKLKKYKLDVVFSELPDGVHSSAGTHGSNLSGGMQKITMLMRGILKKSKIVIMDEPLTGLDKNTKMKVIDMILAETAGKTLIIITHDEEILPHMDEVVNINSL